MAVAGAREDGKCSLWSGSRWDVGERVVVCEEVYHSLWDCEAC
jgi:hypothetical protein